MYTGPFILDVGGYRFYCSYTSKKVMRCSLKYLKEKYPDVEFVARPYMVNMVEVNEKTGEVIGWQKIKRWGYWSIWHRPTNAEID